MDDQKLGYYQLVKKFPRVIFIGAYHTFCSTFGQTVLMAMFVSTISQTYSLSASQYGAIYGGVTIASALLLPFTGPKIDHVHLRRYSLFVGLVIAAGAMILWQSQNIGMLVVGLTLVRHGGQALMTHASSTTVARFFSINRGKALSYTNIGFALGEASLPAIVAFCLTLMHWQNVFLGIAVFVAVLFMIPIFFLVKSSDSFAVYQKPKDQESELVPSKTRKDVFKSLYFYGVLPAYLAAPFLLTGFIFHQQLMAEGKGWSIAWMASAISAFAGIRVLGSFLAGPLIDRFAAFRILPFHLLPLALALLIYCFWNSKWGAYGFWAFAGLTIAIGGVMKQAIWAEVFGTKNLGSIKSVIGPFTVLSTAGSPFLFGYIADKGVSFERIALASVVFIGVISVVAYVFTRYAPHLQGNNTA